MDWLDQTVYFYYEILVLVNGTPNRLFQSSKGMRQGNPLTPYLFVYHGGAQLFTEES